MAKMTIKQQKFADEYIKLGDGAKAYREAYPNVKKDTTARVNASRLLTKANVKAYIAERMEELKSERVADQQEIMEFLTSVIRGEVMEPVAILDGEGTQKVVNLQPSVQTRKGAAVDLGKRYAMWTEKQQVENITPVFVEDVPEDDE